MIESKALKIYQADDKTSIQFENINLSAPADGELIVQVHYSSVNYKDALAVTGSAKILRQPELIGGIDMAGVVVASNSSDFAEGDMVLVNGSGFSEVMDGGYATYAKVPTSIAIPIPQNLNAKQVMLMGTAGFTATLAILRMEQNGQVPEMGKVLVSGAGGGVGSLAVHLLSKLGFDVVALSRKQGIAPYLSRLGAGETIAELAIIDGHLGKTLWAGGIDNLGGQVLADMLKATKPQGNVVSIGLAKSVRLELSVMPFIIRGVSLLGVTSANCPLDVKRTVWRAISDRMMPDDTCFDEVLAYEVALSELATTDCFQQVLAGKVKGRILVNCQQ